MGSMVELVVCDLIVRFKNAFQDSLVKTTASSSVDLCRKAITMKKSFASRRLA